MKRRLLIIAICLLLGAVVNVAVAWSCAIWSSLPPPGRMRAPAPADQAWWQEHAWMGITSEPILLSMTEAFGSEYRLLTGARKDAGINVRVEFYDDGLVQALEYEYPSSQSSPNPWDQALLAEAGWPLRSLAGERWRAAARLQAVVRALAPAPGRPPAGSEAVHVAAILIQRSTAGRIQHRLAPLRPLWPGFAINTLFYATILWLLIPGPFALRRFLRMRRGLCPKCAYPMGESSVCTECGKPLPTRTVANRAVA